MELVSIIIPTFGRPKTLNRAIKSVLNQTYSMIEIIVVDDNPPESQARKDTEEVMMAFENYPNFLYIKHSKNFNGSTARNTGVEYSSGKYLMFLDDDDEFLPSKIESQVYDLEKLNKEWGANYTNYYRYENGKKVTESAERREGNLYVEELGRNFFLQAGSNLMVRREIFLELKGFDTTFERNQDIEFCVRLLKKYKISYVDDVGLIHHTDYKVKRDLEKITDNYLMKFRNDLLELSDCERRRVMKLIYLQLVRYYFFEEKNLRKILKILVEKKLSIFEIIRYFLHLGKRFWTGKCYGYLT